MLVSMNRSDLPYLKEQDFASHTAIYVLIGGNKRYVGQAAGQTIYQRLYQHFSKEDKKWVESVLFFSRTAGKLSKLIPIIWRSDSFKISLRNQITK